MNPKEQAVAIGNVILEHGVIKAGEILGMPRTRLVQFAKEHKLQILSPEKLDPDPTPKKTIQVLLPPALIEKIKGVNTAGSLSANVRLLTYIGVAFHGIDVWTLLRLFAAERILGISKTDIVSEAINERIDALSEDVDIEVGDEDAFFKLAPELVRFDLSRRTL
jgi:hypothetical protein